MNVFNPSKLKYEFKEFIGIYNNAFTEKECEDTIKLFDKYDRLGYTHFRTYESKDILNCKDDISKTIYPSLELDWNVEFIKSFHSRFDQFIYPLYNNQYPAVQLLKKHRSKFIKIQKTHPTQGYHQWHCENDGGELDRVLSWILYLNDIEEGGETEFLYQSLRIKPKTGTFILFPGYFTHVHRGNPPLNGVKYIATGWIEFLHTSEQQGAASFPNLTMNQKNVNYT